MFETERLICRLFRDSDREPFARLNGNATVMRYFPSTLTVEQSNSMVDELGRRQEKNGYTFWATERKEDGAFIGFVGLNKTGDNMPFSPSVEIGWRLDEPYWGKGYASEAAKGVLKYAFDKLGVDEVISFTAEINEPSQKVMQRIGMTHEGEYFDHPALDNGHPLKRHILYRTTQK
ncbi:GNAT family N-acetyltransferase [Sneathiella sp. P13V-1]|nr:GNAT family N-acetyltransferase [Sneathiella sp. P13V-1]